jgi:hypothetical protein
MSIPDRGYEDRTAKYLAMDTSTVDHEVKLLQEWIIKLGSRQPDGLYAVAFGPLFEATDQVFEALAGTLKAAKKRGIIKYDAPILLKGSHDKVLITLLSEP